MESGSYESDIDSVIEDGDVSITRICPRFHNYADTNVDSDERITSQKSGQTSSYAESCITTMLAPMLPILCLSFYPKKESKLCHIHPTDLAPNAFFLYPHAKKELKGRRFPTATAAIKTLEVILKVLSKEDFEHVFKEWQRRWNRCVALNGD
ncbi:hypothetical protein J6590_054953 [Homalodisca vitripennis]|nr:hypothetical protein J6590_054953 [Homalodisca vitripennis]